MGIPKLKTNIASALYKHSEVAKLELLKQLKYKYIFVTKVKYIKHICRYIEPDSLESRTLICDGIINTQIKYFLETLPYERGRYVCNQCVIKIVP